jgi:hypothetical protein
VRSVEKALANQAKTDGREAALARRPGYTIVAQRTGVFVLTNPVGDRDPAAWPKDAEDFRQHRSEVRNLAKGEGQQREIDAFVGKRKAAAIALADAHLDR